MSEETPASTPPQETAPEQPAGEPQDAPASKPLPPAVILAFVIIALLGALLVIAVKSLGGLGVSGEELNALRAEEKALRTQLNNERASLGLRPLSDGSESVDEIAARLKRDADTIVALAGSFQSMLAEKDAEISAKNNELIRSEQLRQTLTAESARLNSELQRALVNASDSDLLRRNLDAMTAQRDALAAQVSTLKQELANSSGGASADEFAALQRRYEETLRAKEFFESRVQELEGEISKAKLFASSESELLPAAVKLFRSLRELEDRPDSDLTTAYSQFGTDLGANVLHTLKFATGSSELSPEDLDVIGQIVNDVPDGDLVLCVGYASETGNVYKNQTLSSDRATAAAECFSGMKRPGQLVQAVYLGQTKRFSSRIPERNQLVEIWRIRRNP